MSEAYELVKFVDGSFELEVNVSPEEDTVWLTQEQMAVLFQKAKSTINWHINKAYEEGELSDGTMKKFENIEFSKKPTNYYNLDVVIAVGYRVKSLRGVIFRKWATSVLRQYMLKGFALEPSRVLVSRENYLDLVNVVNRIDSTQTALIGRVERLEDKYPEFGMRIFFKGQLYDFNAQYPSLEKRITDEFHERFLILDRKRMYHIGASVKNAGRRSFEISENKDGRYLDMILERLNT